MKKLLIGIFICCLCAPCLAQDSSETSNFNIGITFGINSTNVDGHETSTTSKTGYSLGGFLNFQTGNYLSYQIG